MTLQGRNKNNGKAIIGTCESIKACTAYTLGFTMADDGTTILPEYEGETDVNWDGQETDYDDHGEMLFVDEDHNVVPQSQVEFTEQEEE